MKKLLIIFTMATLVGCQAISLSNRTNQITYAGGVEYAYNNENDVFIHGPVWEYKLKVNREHNSINRQSIQPSVIIGDESYPMVISDDWNNNTSYWVYERTPDCVNPDAPFIYDKPYRFVVNYARSNYFFVSKPPGKIPSSGSYNSKIVNMGIHFVPKKPYPNHESTNGIIYDQNCWETGTGCVPEWKQEEIFSSWPSELSYTFTIMNSELEDAIITEITTDTLDTDHTGYNYFDVSSNSLPMTVQACSKAQITVIYTPPTNSGYHEHQFQLRTKMQWANLPNIVSGPGFKAYYEIQTNPQ